jgi:hypothetical protein
MAPGAVLVVEGTSSCRFVLFGSSNPIDIGAPWAGIAHSSKLFDATAAGRIRVRIVNVERVDDAVCGVNSTSHTARCAASASTATVRGGPLTVAGIKRPVRSRATQRTSTTSNNDAAMASPRQVAVLFHHESHHDEWVCPESAPISVHIPCQTRSGGRCSGTLSYRGFRGFEAFTPITYLCS